MKESNCKLLIYLMSDFNKNKLALFRLSKRIPNTLLIKGSKSFNKEINK